MQVSRKSVTRWENGWNVPALVYAQKMAELFSTTVGELMNGNPSTEAADSTPRLKGLLILYCALTFLPVLIIKLGERVLGVIREMLRVRYGPPSADDGLFWEYLDKLETLHKTLFWVAAVAAAILLAGWVAKLVHIFECTDDKYRRFLAYRRWRIGLVFLFACTYTALFDVYTRWWAHSYDLVLKLISGFFVGFWLMLVFDILFRRFANGRFLSGQNAYLKKLNLAFVVIGGVLMIAFIVLLIVGWHERFLVFTLFQLLCLFAAIAYIVSGAVLLSRQYRRRTD